MKISRRKLLAGAAAGAAAPALGGRFSHGSLGQTVFRQGALGGGGYSCELGVSDDGLTFVTRSDTYQANIFNPHTQLWENIYTSDRFSGLQWGQGGGVHAIAVAGGDSNRIYVCSFGLKNGLGSNNRYKPNCTVFRSNDRGLTFTPTAMTTIAGDIGGNRLSSPKMAVDPNNADIVYIANQAGVFFVTYNGGATWSLVSPLLPALSTTTIALASNAGETTLKVKTNAITASITRAKSAGYAVYVYNIDHPASVGNDAIGCNVQGVKNNGDGTTSILVGTYPQGTSSVGDTLYVGASGYVAFDKTGGTVANPGIALGASGASGVASKNIYFGWGWGAAHMWQSTDGGVNFSAMTSGPFQIAKPKVSNDANGGVLYCVDNPADLGFGTSGATSHTNCWRYVPEVAPSGSGLTPNTWTNLSVHTPGWWSAVVPDPKKPGHVVSIVHSDNLYDSTDWGKTFAPGSNTVGAVGRDDPPWLAVTGDPFGQNFGDAVFDPRESGKLWMCNGIGVWYTTNTTARKTTWTSRTAGLDSMTVQRVLKPPGGNIYVACMDRPMFAMPNINTYPLRDHPYADGGPSSISHGGDFAYAESDPTVVFGSAGGRIWRTTNGGANWAQIGTHGVNGFNGGRGSACLAATTPINVVQAPTPSGDAHYIQRGTSADGGATWTWTNCTYNGNPMPSNGTFDYTTNAKWLCSDGAGNFYIYDMSNTLVSGGGVFKSTDGGANFSLISRVNLTQYSGNICPVLAVMPGFPNILFYAPGSGYSPKAYAPTPLRVSFDAGVTWASIKSTFQAYQVAFGKAKPGNTYPAIYISGNVADWPNPMNVYRCDNFDGATTNLHWIPLNNMNLVCCDGSRCLAGDPDVYGTVYIGTASSGYLVGTIT
jgi:hypothetical protein